MSGSRTTRKVTIDSARRISTSGDMFTSSSSSQPKKKSVFDRLGVSGAKSVVNTLYFVWKSAQITVIFRDMIPEFITGRKKIYWNE